MTGTIKRLMESNKGFGFIASEEIGKDVFFHFSQLEGSSFEQLQVGDPVTFDVQETPKGLQAVNVRRA